MRFVISHLTSDQSVLMASDQLGSLYIAAQAAHLLSTPTRRILLCYRIKGGYLSDTFTVNSLILYTRIKESYHDVDNPDQLRVLAYSTLC